MKIANLITTIISSLFMFAVDFIMFCIAFTSSMIGAFVYDSSHADRDNIHQSFGSLALTILIAVIAIASIVLGIVGFVKSRKPGASAKTYACLYGITCGATLIANLCAIPLPIWINDFVGDAEFFMGWPVIGFILLIPMVIFTILATRSISKCK